MQLVLEVGAIGGQKYPRKMRASCGRIVIILVIIMIITSPRRCSLLFYLPQVVQKSLEGRRDVEAVEGCVAGAIAAGARGERGGDYVPVVNAIVRPYMNAYYRALIIVVVVYIAESIIIARD